MWTSPRDLQITSPQVLVDINRDKASSLGISAGQIERTLGSAYGARQISTIYTPTDQYRLFWKRERGFQARVCRPFPPLRPIIRAGGWSR